MHLIYATYTKVAIFDGVSTLKIQKNPQGRAWLVSFSGISGVGKTDLANITTHRLITETGARVLVFSENTEDPLRDTTNRIKDWLDATKAASSEQIMGVLFAAGRGQLVRQVNAMMRRVDVVILDRWLWDNIAYQGVGAPGFTMQQIYNLNAEILGVPIPDLSIIVDGDIANALQRRALRDKHQVGTAGQMGGDYANRQRIQSRFRHMVSLFTPLPIHIVENPGQPTFNINLRRQMAAKTVEESVLPLFEKYGIITQ